MLIEAHEHTIRQKNETAQKRNKSIRIKESQLKQVEKTIRENDKQIKSLNNHLARQDDIMRAKDFAYEDLEKRMGDQVEALRSQLAAKDDEIEAFQLKFRKMMLGGMFKGPSGSKERTAKGNLKEEGSEEGEVIKLIKLESMEH